MHDVPFHPGPGGRERETHPILCTHKFITTIKMWRLIAQTFIFYKQVSKAHSTAPSIHPRLSLSTKAEGGKCDGDRTNALFARTSSSHQYSTAHHTTPHHRRVLLLASEGIPMHALSLLLNAKTGFISPLLTISIDREDVLLAFGTPENRLLTLCFTPS